MIGGDFDQLLLMAHKETNTERVRSNADEIFDRTAGFPRRGITFVGSDDSIQISLLF